MDIKANSIKKAIRFTLATLMGLGLCWFQTNAQPIQFEEGLLNLKSMTDSSGTVHLFYRKGVDEQSFNIRHFNRETEVDSVLLEDRISARIIDYKFFNNDPTKVIYFGKDFIKRYDDAGGFEGYLAGYTFNGLHIPVNSPPSDIVYATTKSDIFIKTQSGFRTASKVRYGPGEQALIGFEKGKKWPDADSLNLGHIPDSTVLDFPLMSLSPFDNNVMFGWRVPFDFKTGFSELYRSTDGGTTREVVMDTLAAHQRELLFYDADSTHIYLLDDCTIKSISCSQALYKSADLGAKGSWELVSGFGGRVDLIPHSEHPGELYLRTSSAILKSTDHGETFTPMYQTDTEIIRGVAVEGNRVFFITPTKLFQLENGRRTRLIDTSVSTTREPGEIPSQVKLHQNYPNPFNPSTTIRFDLRRATQVSLAIYDITGREITTLLSRQRMSSGRHQIEWNAAQASSGIYFYRLEVNGQEITRKMMLIK